VSSHPNLVKKTLPQSARGVFCSLRPLTSPLSSGLEVQAATPAIAQITKRTANDFLSMANLLLGLASKRHRSRRHSRLRNKKPRRSGAF
jgi:hypothetical protein